MGDDVVRRKQTCGRGAWVNHLVHIHTCVHPLMVSVRGHTTVALEAPIETSIDLLTLIDKLLGLLGMPQVVIPNLTQVLLLLFEIVALSWPDKAALVRYAKVL